MSIFKQYENSSFSNLVKRGFCFQYDEDVIGKADVLFVGINPAFDGNDEFIAVSYQKSQTKEKIIPYFKQFHEIEQKLDVEYQRKITWTHLDV